MSRKQKYTLDARRVMAGLDTDIVGRQVHFYPSVDSTNVIASNMAEKEADEGLVILADEQTAGRGRHGRRWDAPAGSSVLMSVLFRPDLPSEKINLLTMIMSLAALDGIRDTTDLEATIKWPNDVLINNLKVGGVLTEGSFVGDRLDYAVIGLGLNANFDRSEFPGIPPAASSLMIILGGSVDRLALVQAILRAADRRYLALKSGQSPFEEWAQRLSTLGQRVQVTLPGEIVEGVAEGVDQQGRLRVRKDDDVLVEVTAGDVVMLRRRED